MAKKYYFAQLRFAVVNKLCYKTGEKVNILALYIINHYLEKDSGGSPSLVNGGGPRPLLGGWSLDLRSAGVGLRGFKSHPPHQNPTYSIKQKRYLIICPRLVIIYLSGMWKII